MLRGRIMKRSIISFRPLSSIALVAILASLLVSGAMPSQTQNQSPAEGQEILWNFIQAQDSLASNLTKIDTALTNASSALSKMGLEGLKAQAILLNLSTVDPAQTDCITVGLNGSILEAEPAGFSYIKGKNIEDRTYIKELFATKRPAGLAYIRTIEGFHAMDFAVPVFNEKGCLIGATTILINNTRFFGRVLSHYEQGNGTKIWVMQPDGFILYETDSSQIGLNAFDAPIFKQFPDLTALAKSVSTESSGYGAYEFYNDQHTQVVKKELYWVTVYHQGEPIRLMLTCETA
jgi:hypothetical protein